MQYRTYRFQTLQEPYSWTYINSEKDSKTFVNYDTLVYAAGGSVASYVIDNDYMVSNNSTINIAKETSAVAGQIITLIDDSGAYDTGVVTSVDNAKLQILYKSVHELFNGDILNPMRIADTSGENGAVKYLYDAVEDTATILASYFSAAGTDRYKRLPLRIRTSGGGSESGKYRVPAVWQYVDNTVNIKEWLLDIFDNHNIVIQCGLVFEVGRAYIDVYVSHNTSGGRLLKNNIHGMTMDHAEGSSANATVCQVIDKDTKILLDTYYLLDDNTVTTSGVAPNRVQPYKLVVAELDQSNEDGATTLTVAQNKLLYKAFNHYVSVKIDRNSRMYPKALSIGDAVTIITDTVNPNDADSAIEEYNAMASIYTGRKENSQNSQVTLIFGKIRINYTDLMQMRQLKFVRT